MIIAAVRFPSYTKAAVRPWNRQREHGRNGSGTVMDYNIDPRDIPVEQAQGMMVAMFEGNGYPVGAVPLEPTLAILRMFGGRE